MTTILTAGDSGFANIIKVSMARASRFGYDMIIYDLGGLGFGKKFAAPEGSFVKKPFPACYHKPKVVLDCLRGLEPGAFLVYLDADAVLNGEIDDAFGDYDVGVTLRPQNEVGASGYAATCYIQAGVMFFVNTPGAEEFIARWDAATQRYGVDQLALNKLLAPHTDWKSCDTMVEVDGVRVRILPAETYNFYNFQRGYSDENKILHFKGVYRKRFQEIEWT